MAPIVSTDDHVVENPELWSSRLSRSRFGDRVPHIERQADGADCWIIEGKRLPLLGSGSAGALTIDRTGEPRRFEEIAAQAWKPSQRLAAMNRDGIDFSVLYPSVAGVAGETFARVADPELELACVQAYNDYLIEARGGRRRPSGHRVRQHPGARRPPGRSGADLSLESVAHRPARPALLRRQAASFSFGSSGL